MSIADVAAQFGAESFFAFTDEVRGELPPPVYRLTIEWVKNEEGHNASTAVGTLLNTHTGETCSVENDDWDREISVLCISKRG